MDKFEKRRIVGLDILRIWMCFEVVICHFWFINTEQPITRFLDVSRLLAVPVFFIISFYFMEKGIEDCINKDNGFVKKRCLRLLYPHMVWSIIYFGIYNLLYVIELTDEQPSFYDLALQILTGSNFNLNMSMWFQIDLVIIMLLFIGLRMLFKDKWIYLIIIISIISLGFHYLGINYNIFKDASFDIKYSFGRLIEVIPYASIGIIMSHFNFIDIINKRKMIFRILSAFIYVLWVGVIIYINNNIGQLSQILSDIFPSMSYAGIYLLIGSVSLFVLFSTINTDNESVSKIIGIIGKATFGVYCCHRLVWNSLRNLLWDKLNESMLYTLSYCFLIFSFSILISIIISNVGNKWIKGLVN